MERTQVGIVGAGPAGLLLAHLLHIEGIDSVILEARSREYVEHRVRAGVCEHTTVGLLRDLGLAGRLDREGLPHEGFALRFDGADHRIDLAALTGKSITVYGQQEIVKDLIEARLATGPSPPTCSPATTTRTRSPGWVCWRRLRRPVRS
jgi:p-hydroxybenzoate 3-monooxygenase